MFDSRVRGRRVRSRSVSISPGSGSLAYIIGTYPLLTTTFVDREIEHVESRGVDVEVISLRKPARMLSPSQERAMTDVRYVMPVRTWGLLSAHLGFLLRRPLRLLGTFALLGSRRHPSIGLRLKTLLHVGLGVVVAAMLRRDPPDHIHAHFVDRATTVAWVCSRLLDVPFSATAHANDIYVGPVLLNEKLAAAKFVATCTEYNADHLRRGLGDHLATIAAVHHGLDTRALSGSDRSKSYPPVVLSVGQLKEKKGLRYLIEAASLLAQSGQGFHVVVAGDGPLRSELESLVESIDLSGRVTFTGAVPHGEVLRLMQEATVFVLPAVVAADGDRDGIPNVILEAMAMGVPVVSTRHSGIPEAVIDGETGRLVATNDAGALARAISEMLGDPETARQMGHAGQARVAERFDLGRNVDALLELMRS